MTRLLGVAKTGAVLMLIFLLCACVFDVTIAGIVTAAIAIYALVAGEYIALVKDSAIAFDRINEYDRMQLQSAMETLTNTVQREKQTDISGVKLYVIPRDDINAFSYGIRSIAVTSGLLNSCDLLCLEATLSHEISHTLWLDACFNRAIFAAVLSMVVYLSFMSLTLVAFIWIIFLFLALFGICRGFLGMFITRGASNLTKGLFTGIQNVFVSGYKAFIGVVSRQAEFRADEFAASLGYGGALSYFLERFSSSETHRQSISELLYNSHPQPYVRIQRLAEYERNRAS